MMLKWLMLAGLVAGGFYAYRRLMAPVDDAWDDDTMYGSADLHQTQDVQPTPAT